MTNKNTCMSSAQDVPLVGMREQHKQYPYKKLGSYLKQLRVKLQESLAEVSGAVEIDVAQLNEIETGTQRPSEDILLLLISHFSIKEDEAVKLWELAEFHDNDLPLRSVSNGEEGGRQAAIVTPEELKISYTDMVHVTVNNYGVVMNFMQSMGPTNQPMIVSRVGMSKEHAQSVLDILHKTLKQSEQKRLPAPKSKKDKKD